MLLYESDVHHAARFNLCAFQWISRNCQNGSRLRFGNRLYAIVRERKHSQPGIHLLSYNLWPLRCACTRHQQGEGKLAILMSGMCEVLILPYLHKSACSHGQDKMEESEQHQSECVDEYWMLGGYLSSECNM